MAARKTLKSKQKKAAPVRKTSRASKSEKPSKPSRPSRAQAQKPEKEGYRVFRVITGVVFGIAAIYTLAVLISYIFTWSQDQSLLSTGDVITTSHVVHNVGGRVGFLWSNLLVSKLFGFGAFTVPFFLGAISIFCLRIRRVNLVRLFLVSMIGAIVLSVAFSFIFGLFGMAYLLGSGPGGSYGFYVTKWLCDLMGDLGAGCIILLALFLWGVMLSRRVAFWFEEKLYFTAHYPFRKWLTPQVVTDDPAAGSGLDALTAEDEPGEPDAEVPLWPSAPAGGAAEIDLLGSSEGAAAGDADGSLDDDGLGDDLPDDLPSDDDIPVAAAGPEAPSAPVAAPDAPATPEVTLDVEESQNDFLANLTDEEKEHYYNPKLDLPDFQLPSISMLEDYRDLWHEVSRDELERNKQKIVNALGNYKIGVVGITAKMGPTVTLYKIRLADGVKIAQVRRLEEDIAMSIGAKGVRVVTLLDSVGIEVPNEHPSVVPLKSVLNSPQFKEAKMELPLAMGITVTNEPFFLDLAKMPHLLVAGATGMGKSVGLNCIIASLLYAKHPAELKLVMVDPKKVEFSIYNKLEKHYLAMMADNDDAIITDTKNVVTTLKSLCVEMDDRYDLLKKADVRQIKEYNAKFLARRLNPLKGHKFLPYIVVIIDEFADLLMTAGREVEEPIARLAQKARAVGIHLVIATQRPTTDIITGTIKANFNSRIAFRVNSSVDSKTIIDGPGANRLIGRGDMLVIRPGADLERVQCALIDTPEIIRINKFINEQSGYDHAFYLPEYVDPNSEEDTDVDLRKRDKLFEEAAKIVVQYQQGSASNLQRKLNIGYNRAGRLIDQLEAAGIVGRAEGSKPRAVLIADFDALDRKLESLDHQTIM